MTPERWAELMERARRAASFRKSRVQVNAIQSLRGGWIWNITCSSPDCPICHGRTS